MARNLGRPARWVRAEASYIVGELRATSSPQPDLAAVAVPPPGAGRPVLLIPGLLSGDQSLAYLQRWLAHHGYRPIAAGFSRNSTCPHHSVERLAGGLREALTGLHRRAAVIGHSKGGLIAYALGQRYPELVERVLTLGSPLAAPTRVRWNTRMVVRALALRSRLRPEPGTMRGCYTEACECASARVMRAGGPPAVPTVNLYSHEDGIVPPLSCLRPGVEAIRVSAMHNSMPWEPEVLAAIGRWLARPVAAPMCQPA